GPSRWMGRRGWQDAGRQSRGGRDACVGAGKKNAHDSFLVGTDPGHLLLVTLADRPSEADLAIIDADIEAAFGADADPRLEGDRGPVTSVVRKWHELAVIAFAALGELEIRHHLSSLIETL